MHKLLLIDILHKEGKFALKKIIKKKNRSLKSVNNHKIKIYHKKSSQNHIVSKDLEKLYEELGPIYQELDNDYMAIDMIDLIFYERWLNG